MSVVVHHDIIFTSVNTILAHHSDLALLHCVSEYPCLPEIGFGTYQTIYRYFFLLLLLVYQTIFLVF